MSAFFTRPGIRLAIAAALLALPSIAYANSGIGYFMVLLPVMAAALLPVIPLEAFVLMRMLKLPFGRALYLSFIANLWSTLAGIVLGIVIDLVLIGLTGTSGLEFTRGAAAVMLVPMFFITWKLEFQFLRKRLTELPPARVQRVSFAANLVSYAAMMACTLAFLPEHGRYPLRAYMSEAILGGSELRTEVTEFWATHKRLPADVKELKTTSNAGGFHEASIGLGSRITVTIKRPKAPPVHGKRVYLWPVVDGEKLIWKCGSPDIDVRYMPTSCRDSMP